MKAMLDTNTCIYAMQRARGFAPRLPLRDCGISVVVLGELEWGVQHSVRVAENREALEHWLTAVQVVEMDIDVARRYGRIRADLAAAGQPIGPNDLWIAAHALALDLPLITHNVSEFGRIPELSIDTWMNPPPAAD